MGAGIWLALSPLFRGVFDLAVLSLTWNWSHWKTCRAWQQNSTHTSKGLQRGSESNRTGPTQRIRIHGVSCDFHSNEMSISISLVPRRPVVHRAFCLIVCEHYLRSWERVVSFPGTKFWVLRWSDWANQNTGKVQFLSWLKCCKHSCGSFTFCPSLNAKHCWYLPFHKTNLRRIRNSCVPEHFSLWFAAGRKKQCWTLPFLGHDSFSWWIENKTILL